MAIQSFQLDPTAVYLSDDAVVGKVNTATANITRANSVSAAARPIAAGEVGATELAGEEFLTAEKTKLTGIDEGAKDDQTGAEIKTAYEVETGAYTDTKDTKLTGIEADATTDQTGAEIKTAYEAEANAYTDTKDTKLTGIDEGAEVNPADLAALDSVAASKLTGIEDNAKDDQTGAEMRDEIVAIADVDRKLVITNPLTGEYKITAIQRNSTGELDVDYDDVATT